MGYKMGLINFLIIFWRFISQIVDINGELRTYDLSLSNCFCWEESILTRAFYLDIVDMLILNYSPVQNDHAVWSVGIQLRNMKVEFNMYIDEKILNKMQLIPPPKKVYFFSKNLNLIIMPKIMASAPIVNSIFKFQTLEPNDQHLS